MEPPYHPTPIATGTFPSSELRHITSANNLTSPTREHRLSNRPSQSHLRISRLGSPASIPSSPTSVHSSSSAIFERDIEPINPSPHSLSHDPHHIARARHTEQLDQSVPSVLDSAAEILTSSISGEDSLDSISILAPVAFEGPRSGFTSPTSRLSSRSPSPTATSNRRSMLLNIPSPSPSFTLPLPLSQQSPLQATRSVSPPSRPAVQTSAVDVTPSAATPTSAYFSVDSESTAESSPTTATHHEHPLHTLSTPSSTTASAAVSPISPNGTTLSAISSISHPPSPKAASKRLSFISYTDLLTSAPSSTLPLTSFTVQVNGSEPPPHLPSVIGLPQAHAQLHGVSSSANGSIHGVDRDPTTGMLDDMGGEWEREGLGRGLEERLEALMPIPSPTKA